MVKTAFNEDAAFFIKNLIKEVLKDNEYAEYLENIYQINFDEEVRFLVFQAENNMRTGSHV